MVPFSVAYLVPLVIAALGGEPVLPLARLLPFVGALVCAAACRSLRTHSPFMLAGALLFLLCGDVPESAVRGIGSGSAAIPVTVEGVVGGPCSVINDQCLIPLARGPALLIPAPVPGPLPGTKVRALGRLEARGRDVVLFDERALQVVEPPPFWHPGALCERWRRLVRERLDVGLTARTAAHLKTLLLGDRALDPGERDRLARTGTLHLFAVSGMHLMLLLGLLKTVAGPRPRLLLLVLVAYAALTGFASPVGRALLTSAGALWARVVGRKTRPGGHFLLSMALLLAWDPDTLVQAGFLLSYAAYSGIIFLALPAVDRIRRDPLRRIIEGQAGSRAWIRLRPLVIVSIAAFATSLLPTVLLFHRLSPAAIPGTILLTPVVHAQLVISIVLALFPGQAPFGWAAEASVALLDAVVAGLERLPGASLDVARPPLLFQAFFIATLCTIALRISSGRRLRGVVLAAVLSAGLILIPSGGAPGFHLLASGRGAALLFAGAEGSVLVDCGPRSARVADQILDRGLRTLDAVLITHAHEDHAGGLPEVSQRLSVKSVFAPQGVALRNLSLRPVSCGVRPLPFVEVLWPPLHAAPAGGNDCSVVCLLQSPEHRVLSTGDLETRGLRALLRASSIPPADVLIIPHHGARNDALPDLLLRTRPDEVWIPARAGFPDEGTLLLLGWCGAATAGTWKNHLPSAGR